MVPSAGVMFSIPTYPSRPTSSSSSRKATSSPEAREPRGKPKKVNSEIRKQQNRIASRNYREKRKRKLQYLQQLLRDGESPERAARAVEEAHLKRVVTPEYHTEPSPTTSFSLPSNVGFSAPSSTSGNAINPVFSNPETTYEGRLRQTPQTYPHYGHSWNAPMYNPAPSASITTWNVPAWMPNMDFTPSGSSQPEQLQCTPPPQMHHAFEPLPTPSQHARTPDPEPFILGSYGHYRRAACEDQHMMGMSDASLPSSASSSPFPFTRYARVP